MGLIDEFMSKKMIIKWTNEEENKRRIIPDWYLAIESNYKNPIPKTRAEIKEEEEKAIVSTLRMFNHLPNQSRIISGAIALDYILGYTPNTSHTNLDLILVSQLPVIAAHIDAAKKENMYSMWRRSGKLTKESKIKYHIFKPTYAKEIIGKRDFTQKNPELTKINIEANMIEDFSAENHFKIKLHMPVPGGFICREDKKPIIYPKEYFRGIPFTIKGERFYLIDPRYMYLKLKQIANLKENNYLKHLPYLTKLEVFLRDNYKEFPIKGFNC